MNKKVSLTTLCGYRNRVRNGFYEIEKGMYYLNKYFPFSKDWMVRPIFFMDKDGKTFIHVDDVAIYFDDLIEIVKKKGEVSYSDITLLICNVNYNSHDNNEE